MKTKLLCETSLKKWQLKMWRQAFGQDFPQSLILKVNLRKTTPEATATLRGRPEHDPRTHESVSQRPRDRPSPSIFRGTLCRAKHSVHPPTLKTAFRARLPSKSENGWKWKMWKWSFRARHPSKSDSWRYENKAVVRDIPQKVTVEVAKTKLSHQTSPHTHTHTLAFSEPFLRILVWNASYVQKHSNYTYGVGEKTREKSKRYHRHVQC